MHHFTLIAAVAGLVFGVLGAVLGVINTVRAILNDRVHVKVVPVWVGYTGVDGGVCADGVGVEVRNLGFVPVTITHLGFTLSDSDEHMAFFPTEQSLCRLPQRMEARTSRPHRHTIYHMSDTATFHAAFDGASVTVRIDYSRLGKTKSVTEIIEFVWEGKPSPKIIPQYIAWMHTVMCQVAQRINQKILYVYPPAHGHGPDLYAYYPDGTYKKTDA